MTGWTPIVHVVDDDSRTAVMRVLQTAGYEVRGYASAGEFLLGRSDRNAPGCAVLDVAMPAPSAQSPKFSASRGGSKARVR